MTEKSKTSIRLEELELLKEDLMGYEGLSMLIGLVALLFFSGFAFLLGAGFLNSVLFAALCFGMAAVAWDFLGGFTGYDSYGHALFFGIGGYTTVVMASYYYITPWLGVIVGGIFSMLLALAFSYPMFRLKGGWFALGTLALPEVFKYVFSITEYLNGSQGISVPSKLYMKEFTFMQWTASFPYIITILPFIGIELFVIYVLLKGKVGYYLRSIRENEMTAEALGINTFRYKVLAFAVSGFFTGIAGGIYFMSTSFVDPWSAFNLILISVTIVVCAVLGGMNSIVGPLIGALVLIPLRNYIRAMFAGGRFLGVYMIIVGALFIIISVFLPEGILGTLRKKGYFFKRHLVRKERGEES